MIYLIVFFVVWALACCWAADKASLPVVQEYRGHELPVVDDGRGQERALEAQLRLLDPLLGAQAWRDEMVLLDSEVWIQVARTESLAELASIHAAVATPVRWWRSLHLVRVIMARATYYKGPKPPPPPKRRKSRRPYEAPPPKFEPMLPKGVWRRGYPDGHQVTSRERQAGRRRKDLSKVQFAFDLADTQGWGSWA